MKTSREKETVWTQLRNFVPEFAFFDTIREYKCDYLAGDLSAGLVVGVMLIPQGMAYALLAGLPAEYGLVSPMFALPLYAMFGSSSYVAVGPTALMSILNAEAVAELGVEEQSEEWVRRSLQLAFLLGVIQFLLGLIHAGNASNFLSQSVLNGFTFAAAIIIGTSQLPKIFGVTIPRSSMVIFSWRDIILELAAGRGHGLTLLIGAMSLLLFFVLKWLKQFLLSTPWVQAESWRPKAIKAVPNALIVVIVFTAIAAGSRLDDAGVAVVGEIPSGVPAPVNVFGGDHVGEDMLHLLPTAFVMAIIGFMESYSVAKAMSMQYGGDINANQELLGLGFANIGSFFNILPSTGAFSRATVLADAGGRTTMSGLVSAVILLLVVYLLTDLFYFLPSATLAALVVFAVLKLFNFEYPRQLWAVDRVDFGVYLLSLLATFFLGIELGIAVGVAISLLRLVMQASFPHVAHMGRMPDGKTWRNLDRFPGTAKEVRGIKVFRFDGPLFFANAMYFKDLIVSEAAGQVGHSSPPRAIVVDCAAVPSIDAAALHALEILPTALRDDAKLIHKKRIDFLRERAKIETPTTIVSTITPSSGLESLADFEVDSTLVGAAASARADALEKVQPPVPRLYLACIRGPVRDRLAANEKYVDDFEEREALAKKPSIYNCKYPCTIRPPIFSRPTPTEANVVHSTSTATDDGQANGGQAAPDEDEPDHAERVLWMHDHILRITLEHQDVDEAVRFAQAEIEAEIVL